MRVLGDRPTGAVVVVLFPSQNLHRVELLRESIVEEFHIQVGSPLRLLPQRQIGRSLQQPTIIFVRHRHRNIRPPHRQQKLQVCHLLAGKRHFSHHTLRRRRHKRAAASALGIRGIDLVAQRRGAVPATQLLTVGCHGVVPRQRATIEGQQNLTGAQSSRSRRGVWLHSADPNAATVPLLPNFAGNAQRFGDLIALHSSNRSHSFARGDGKAAPPQRRLGVVDAHHAPLAIHQRPTRIPAINRRAVDNRRKRRHQVTGAVHDHLAHHAILAAQFVRGKAKGIDGLSARHLVGAPVQVRVRAAAQAQQRQIRALRKRNHRGIARPRVAVHIGQDRLAACSHMVVGHDQAGGVNQKAGAPGIVIGVLVVKLAIFAGGLQFHHRAPHLVQVADGRVLGIDRATLRHQAEGQGQQQPQQRQPAHRQPRDHQPRDQTYVSRHG